MTRVFVFINSVFTALGSWLQSPLLLLLRLYYGISFIMTGFGKLQNIHQFMDYLISLHIPHPETAAWVVGFTELIGGFLLTIGFLSRLGALPLIIVMSVGYATADVDSIYAFTKDPSQFVNRTEFNFLLTALLVFAFGPGIFSIDALLSRSQKPSVKTEGGPK